MNNLPMDDFDAAVILDESDIDYSDLLEHHSPVKKRNPRSPSQKAQPLTLDTPHVQLKPDDTNLVANSLFQVTQFLRDEPLEDDFFLGKKLNNNKINKLMSQLQSKDDDFELDSQLRTRVFKGRFKSNDVLDMQLNSYLDDSHVDNDNKENLSPYPDPLKSKNMKKSNKMMFKRPGKSQIPVLKPLTNVTNTDLKSSKKPDLENHETKLLFSIKEDHPKLVPDQALSTGKSPNRICVPRTLTPPPPCIKNLTKHNNLIVDSLTGLINDATQFGTELNASNCEGFPLPEDINEVVQIPTNEDRACKRTKAKMAIIKAFHHKHFLARTGRRTGFYSKQEFVQYRGDGVQVTSQASPSRPAKRRRTSPAVHWPEELEW